MSANPEAELARLGGIRRRLTDEAEEIRAAIRDEIVIAHARGIGTVRIARLLGVTRDAVRQTLRAAEAAGVRTG